MAECIFCQIAAGKKPAAIVYQDDSILAFKDINPKSPVHILIIPRKHIVSLAELSKEDLPIAAHMLEMAPRIAKEQGAGSAFKLVTNTGPEAGQVVMHLHMHILGGKRINSLV